MRPAIFVQIASYRDPQLQPTITDCIAKAKYPGRLTFGICYQHGGTERLPEFIAKNYPDIKAHFRILDYHYSESKGLGWARNLLQMAYAGEEYTLQLDSHHRFAQDWDEKLIEMMWQTGVRKPIITSYAPPYDPTDDGFLLDLPLMMVADTFTDYGTIRFRPEYIPNWELLQGPIPARFVSGHFFFTYGKHCKECIYDPSLYFAGDEINLSIRSFTLGYDLFHPHRVVIWHEYTRRGRSKHWTDHTDKLKYSSANVDMRWDERNHYSLKRLRQLLKEEDSGIDLGMYGLGKVRTHKDYERYAGIDFAGRRIQEYTKQGEPPPGPCVDPNTFELLIDEAMWEKRFLQSNTDRASLYIQFAGLQVEVYSNVSKIFTGIASLFREMLSAQPDIVLSRYEVYRKNDKYRLLRNGDIIVEQVSSPEIFKELHREVVRDFIRERPDLIWLHAGSVCQGDVALLFSGPWGRGKSTLVTSLYQDGWSYLSDDIVPLDISSGKVYSFPQTPRVRQESIQILPHDRVAELAKLEVKLKPGTLGSNKRLGAVVFPHYVPSCTAELTSCSPSSAVLELLQSCLSFVTHRQSAMRSLCRLLEHVPAFRLQYSSGELAKDAILRAHEDGMLFEHER